MSSLECIGIKYRKAGKIYDFLPCKETVEIGSKVVVEVDSGVDIATAMYKKTVNIPKIENVKKVLRVANIEDIKRTEENTRDNKIALKICKKIVSERKDSMKILLAEFSLDRNKITFYFGSKERVDFRELVKELASIFKIRIEMRQINPREESKITNGMGICGRELCCASFLTTPQNISIKTIKNTTIVSNPYKLLGNCGKVMCCAMYEQETAKNNKNSSDEIIIRDDIKSDQTPK